MRARSTRRAAALDHIDLDIQGGEFLALLGPSGCGKTPLLRLLAGFESPTEGGIHFDEALIADAQHNAPPGGATRASSAQSSVSAAWSAGWSLVRPAAVRLIEGPANARAMRHRYRGHDHELELALLAPESRLLCDHSQPLAPGVEVRVEVKRGWLGA